MQVQNFVFLSSLFSSILSRRRDLAALFLVNRAVQWIPPRLRPPWPVRSPLCPRSQLAGKLVQGRLPAPAGRSVVSLAWKASVGQFLQGPADLDHAVVAQEPLDLSGDHGDCIGGKLSHHRTGQTCRWLSEDRCCRSGKRSSASAPLPAEPLHDTPDEAHVFFHKLFSRFFIPVV